MFCMFVIHQGSLGLFVLNRKALERYEWGTVTWNSVPICHQKLHLLKVCFISISSPHQCFVGTLVRHERLHTGITPYHCADCGKTFAQQWTLTTHMRTHTGEKPYSCSQCDKSFVAPGELRRHTRIHTGEKPYTCSECGRHFSLAGTLRNHKRSCSQNRTEPEGLSGSDQTSADETVQELTKHRRSEVMPYFLTS